MSNQVVLITGALTGIGRATAVAFAAAGAAVVVAGRREEEGKKLEKELRELGAEAQFVKADVRHEPEIQSLVDETVKRFGRLDVAVNNAGTEGSKGPITSQTSETYADTFETNVLGVLLSMKHELRVMLPQGRGSVITAPCRRSGHEGVAEHATLRCEQARCRGPHKISRAGGSRHGRESQYRRAWACGDRHARPVHRHFGSESRSRQGRADRAAWRAQRSCGCGGISRFRQSLVHHWALAGCRWRKAEVPANDEEVRRVQTLRETAACKEPLPFTGLRRAPRLPCSPGMPRHSPEQSLPLRHSVRPVRQTCSRSAIDLRYPTGSGGTPLLARSGFPIARCGLSAHQGNR